MHSAKARFFSFLSSYPILFCFQEPKSNQGLKHEFSLSHFLLIVSIHMCSEYSVFPPSFFPSEFVTFFSPLLLLPFLHSAGEGDVSCKFANTSHFAKSASMMIDPWSCSRFFCFCIVLFCMNKDI